LSTILKVENLYKKYTLGKVEVPAVEGVSFEVLGGEFVSIIGPSGCGKSTLMHLVGCLDRPNAGRIWLEGTDVSTLEDNALAQIRNRKVGFVFQAYNLLPRLNALENVDLPLLYSGIEVKKRRELAVEMLKKVGLADRAAHRPAEMSGGQAQRVAIARAFVVNPSLLLADEPTGNLDSKSGSEIMALFQKINAEGVTIIMVTHEADIAAASRRIIQLKDGKILSDQKIEQVVVKG
jgi:putative ABC transport system ATP-binding protein